jgi:hypothetical protein
MLGSMPFAHRFLTDPEAFPPSLGGRPWGRDSLVLCLPGGPYLIEDIGPAQRIALEEHFGDLIREPFMSPEPGTTLSVFQAPAKWFTEVDFTGQEYTFDQDYQRDVVRVAGKEFLGRMELKIPNRAGLWINRESHLVSHGIFENFLRLVLAYRVLSMGGVLLHSAAVVKDGHAHLFIGRSGAGKSTIAKLGLTAGLDVLSDDMNALVPGDDGRYWAEKLPFAGDLGQTATPKGRYPVAGIYRLRQAEHNAIEPISPARAMAALIACSPYVNADPYRNDRLTANLEQLLGSVSVRELMFNLDVSAWELL